MTTKEKRKSARRTVDLPVEFIVHGNLYQDRIFKVWIKNISRSGVFIDITTSFSVGQDISMTYDSPKFSMKKKTGKIVRITSDGIAVKFDFPGYTR